MHSQKRPTIISIPEASTWQRRRDRAIFRTVRWRPLCAPFAQVRHIQERKMERINVRIRRDTNFGSSRAKCCCPPTQELPSSKISAPVNVLYKVTSRGLFFSGKWDLHQHRHAVKKKKYLHQERQAASCRRLRRRPHTRTTAILLRRAHAK